MLDLIYQKVKPLAEEKNIPIKSPELIEAILNESKKVLKTEHVIITETIQGLICANAGIDKSNIEGDFKIKPIENPKDIEYDGAVFGEMKYILNLIRGHMFIRGFWYLITRKIRLKGIKSLLQFLKVIRKVAS